MCEFTSSTEAVEALLNAAGDASSALIVTHDDPDPDAIASGMALAYLFRRQLGLTTTLAHGGIIGRAENKAMVRLLNIETHPIHQLHLEEYDVIAVVDAQPGAGNIGLPEEITPTIVLDHHPALHSETKEGQFVDIRTGCGATSTIVMGYLRVVGLAPDRRTATALFYGIKSDTMGLARAAGEADVEAYLYLLPLADPKTLAQIEQAQVPLAYFRAFEQALERTYIYHDVVVCDLGAMDWPDLAAEMADFLLRWEGAHWVICTGLFDGTIVISVRTTDLDGDAGRVVQAVVRGLGTGGGHGLMAGGRVPLNSRSQAKLTRKLRDRFLVHLGRDEQAREKLI